LKTAIYKYCKDLGCSLRTVKTPTKKMTAGIKINGRQYAAGSNCEIIGRVARTNPHLAADESLFKVATIYMFYTVNIDEEEVVFVELSTHKQKGKHNDVRVVRKKPKSRRRVHSVDVIKYRVKLARHWDKSIDNLLCAVRLWEAV
jgi:hypothetical protein